MRAPAARLLLYFGWGFVSSCVGAIAEPASSVGNVGLPADEGPGISTDEPGSAASACGAPEPGRAPLRRLTKPEYNNTVRDLLGDTTRPADSLPPEVGGNGFGNDADALVVDSLWTDGYFRAAQGIAE